MISDGDTRPGSDGRVGLRQKQVSMAEVIFVKLEGSN